MKKKLLLIFASARLVSYEWLKIGSRARMGFPYDQFQGGGDNPS
jgi:hypothetical protein